MGEHQLNPVARAVAGALRSMAAPRLDLPPPADPEPAQSQLIVVPQATPFPRLQAFSAASAPVKGQPARYRTTYHLQLALAAGRALTLEFAAGMSGTELVGLLRETADTVQRLVDQAFNSGRGPSPWRGMRTTKTTSENYVITKTLRCQPPKMA